ncbi:Equilibrative nucleoside transporter, partial [Globisporangium splendens]
MHSPNQKTDKLIVQEDGLETGRDGMPQEIWDDMVKNENFIYYSLMFLNGSVLWAYYSCLSAQDFYTKEFPDSGLDFSFLTTLVTSWPMFAGQALQMFFGLDKKFSQYVRVHIGYSIFMVMAILIMVFSAINFSNQKTGASLVLFCFACIGFGNSFTEATYYTLAALFPVEKFTNAVQIGNVWAGVLNISINTILRLAIGGPKQTGSSTNTSFYLFFSLLVVVLIAAVLLYRRVIQLPSVKYLMERNEASTKAENLDTQPIGATLANIFRIFKIIWIPALTQFLVLFVSLTLFPGFACTASRNLFPPYSDEAHTVTSYWYCSPGIIGSYNFGDFFGRVFCGVLAYKIFTMNLSFGLSILRFAYIPLLLMGVAGTSLYSFGRGDMGALVFNICLNFTIGITNGLLSTVTMGTAPRMLQPEDRETGGAVMVLFLFLGIAGGSTLGFLIGDRHWFGL